MPTEPFDPTKPWSPPPVADPTTPNWAYPSAPPTTPGWASPAAAPTTPAGTYPPPTEVVALPTADQATSGASGRGNGTGEGRVSRRRFLAGAAGAAGVAGVAALALTHDRWDHLLDSSPASSTSSTFTSGKGTLVVVTLYGGNDGLNTVIPYQDSAYLQGRPTLGYQPSEVLPLGDGLALHPNLKGMKALWDAKQLAIVRGVGYPNPFLSHFRSMDIWQTGSTDEPLATGVFGRWLDATGTDPMRCISIGSTLPPLLVGARSSGSAIDGATISLPGATSLAPILAAFDAPGPDRTGLAARVAQSGSDLLSVHHTLADLMAKHPSATPADPTAIASPTSSTDLAAQLDVVSQLIKAGATTRVYQVSMGGFDNHADEKDIHSRLMSSLDAAISGFMTGLKGSPAGDSVVLMTYSEFGRRVDQNASGGTDHGTAAPLFVVGAPVKGGQFFGEEPALSDLDDGNLKFTTDYRSVFATMLADVVGVDPSVSLSGSFPTLNLV